MKILLRNATIIDAESDYNQQVVDVLLEDGYIQSIGSNLALQNDATEIYRDKLHISRGWFDSSVSFGEPGYEERETIANGLEVAAKSGFSSIALQPNTFPVTDNQVQINFVKSCAIGKTTQLYPIGALTKGSLGLDIAEMYDMKNAGAIAFGDYNKAINNANILKIALEYVQSFDGLVIAFSEDATIKANGLMNEGEVSTHLGLKGNPNLAEEMQLMRNLYLLEYTGGKLHIPTISTAKSAELIRGAKQKGLAVTCSVAVHNLLLTDKKLYNFDSCYKLSPPLRTEEDRKALITAIIDGTIDMITSDHNPMDIEFKKMEFDTAKYGTVGLESAFICLLPEIALDILVQKLTNGKNVFGIANQPIAVGSPADLSLFSPEGENIFNANQILSKSKNSALLGQKTLGKVYGCSNQGKITLD